MEVKTDAFHRDKNFPPNPELIKKIMVSEISGKK